MSERRTLLIDEEGPTSVSSDDPGARTLLIGDAAEARREPTRALPRSLRRFGLQHGYLLLGIIGGASVGFFAALGLQADGADQDVRPGVYVAHCGEADVMVSTDAHVVHSSASRPDSEHRNDPFDESRMARRAADLVVENRYGEALAIYRRLAEHRPEEVAFLHLSSVLEAKLRCASSDSLGGYACD